MKGKEMAKRRKPTKAQMALINRVSESPLVIGIDESGERHFSLANGGGCERPYRPYLHRARPAEAAGRRPVWRRPDIRSGVSA